MIGLLADARLLTVSAGSVEFAHEAMLREWPRLREWIDDDRDDLRIHRNLSSAAPGVGSAWAGTTARSTAERRWRRRASGPSAATRGRRRRSASSSTRASPASAATGRRAAAGLAIAFAGAGARARRDRGRRARRPGISEHAERQRNTAASRELAAGAGDSLDADPSSARARAVGARHGATEQAAPRCATRPGPSASSTSSRRTPSDANAADYSPDGSRVLTGGTEGRGGAVGRRDGPRGGSLDAGHDAVLAARHASSGDRIALGFADGTVAVTTGSLACAARGAAGEGQPVTSVALSERRPAHRRRARRRTVRVLAGGRERAGAAPERPRGSGPRCGHQCRRHEDRERGRRREHPALERRRGWAGTGAAPGRRGRAGRRVLA